MERGKVDRPRKIDFANVKEEEPDWTEYENLPFEPNEVEEVVVQKVVLNVMESIMDEVEKQALSGNNNGREQQTNETFNKPEQEDVHEEVIDVPMFDEPVAHLAPRDLEEVPWHGGAPQIEEVVHVDQLDQAVQVDSHSSSGLVDETESTEIELNSPSHLPRKPLAKVRVQTEELEKSYPALSSAFDNAKKTREEIEEMKKGVKRGATEDYLLSWLDKKKYAMEDSLADSLEKTLRRRVKYRNSQKLLSRPLFMHQSGEPQLMGPTGPYPHQMHQMPYHEQMPTTSHPSWHQQYHPMQPPPNYPMGQPQMAPQQVPQRPPSRGPSAPPPSNQKFRTEQWINNQSWPYAQSPAPPICPSVMSYQGAGGGANNDDRMSMLSVNTQMMYPDGQRCYSSNGSTCENVNPDMAQNSVAQMATAALSNWFTTPDPAQRLHMARTIKTWVKQEKLANIDPQQLPEYVKQILDIVRDGLKPQGQLPHAYYAQLFYHLLDTLRTLSRHFSTTPLANMLVNLFSPNDSFRELFCTFLRATIQSEPHMKHCSNAAFDVLNTLIMGVKQEKLRVELAVNLKHQTLLFTLLEYFDPRCPLNFLNPLLFTVFRFIASRDNRLKDSLIWENETKDKVPPPSSFILKLNSEMMRIAHALGQPETMQNRELVQSLVQLILRTFDLLIMLLHDSAAIEGYIRVDGLAAVCNVIQFPHPDVARAGFKLLVQISDAKALANVRLDQMLPFLMQAIHRSQDDAVIFSGTGFLSNVVAHKQHVKELAIQHNALELIFQLITRMPRPLDVPDAARRQRVVDIICNCLRTLNNLLVPTKNGEAPRQPSEQERMQICRFIEVDMVRKLMSCLSGENLEAHMDASKGLLSVMELRSTVLRFLTLIIKTPFVPKDTLLNIIDDIRNQNLVGHICAAFSWAVRCPGQNPQLLAYRQLLIERGITILLQLMDYCGAERQVAQCAYSIECPLSLLVGEQIKPHFMLNVLVLCDKILTHCPGTAEIWVVDRPMLEALTNHQTPEIAQSANSLLSRLPENDLLAGLLSHQFDTFS